MDTVAVKLSLTDWQSVVNLLAEQPYRISAPLINQIVQQVQPSGPQLPMPNGSDVAEVRQ